MLKLNTAFCYANGICFSRKFSVQKKLNKKYNCAFRNPSADSRLFEVNGRYARLHAAITVALSKSSIGKLQCRSSGEFYNRTATAPKGADIL